MTFVMSFITLPPELFFPSLTKAVFQTMAYIINTFFYTTFHAAYVVSVACPCGSLPDEVPTLPHTLSAHCRSSVSCLISLPVVKVFSFPSQQPNDGP